jgi:hypothetical protein
MWFGRDAEPLGTLKDRSGFQNHAFSSAERTIVDCAMAIVREGPQIMGNHLHGTHTDRAAKNPMLEWTGEEAGENGQDVKMHGN